MRRVITHEYVVPVPGRFRDNVAYLDLETIKVPNVPAWVMQNGETLRRRWAIAMYGVGLNGAIILSDNNTEWANITGLGDIFCSEMEPYAAEVVYAATREFDEMICKGRFTNARRAHEPVPFFTPVPCSETKQWRNIGPDKIGTDLTLGPRQDDILSKDVPEYLKLGQVDFVMVHLLRDVAELIYRDGNPDGRARNWISSIMGSYEYAHQQIMGGEHER